MVRSATDYSATSAGSFVDNSNVDPRSIYEAMRVEAKRREENEKIEQKKAKEREVRRAERRKLRERKAREDEKQERRQRQQQQEEEAKKHKFDDGDDVKREMKDLIEPAKALLRGSSRSESLNVSRPSTAQRHASEKSVTQTRNDPLQHIIKMPYETAASIDDIKVQQAFAELRSSMQWAAKNAVPNLDDMTKMINSYYAENIALMNVPNRLDDPTTTVMDMNTGDYYAVDNSAYDTAAWQQIGIAMDADAARMGADMARMITRRRADEYIRQAKQMLMQAGRYEARVYTIQYPPYCALLSFMPIWTTCRWYGKGMKLYQTISSWTMEVLPGVIDVAISVVTLLIAIIAFFFAPTPLAQEGSVRGVKPPTNSTVPGCFRFFTQTFDYRDTRDKMGVPMLTISSSNEANGMEKDEIEKTSESTTFIAIRYCLKEYEWASAKEIYKLGTHVGRMSDLEALQYAQQKSSGLQMSFTDKVLIFPIRCHP